MTNRRLESKSQPNPTTGSPQPGEPVFLAIGKLGRPHGVEGEVVMEIITDFPQRLRVNKTLYIGSEYKPMRLTGVRSQNKNLLLRFEGITDRDQVGLLRNLLVHVRAENLPDLPDGEYYHHQLIGMAVVDQSGTPLGILTEIMETGANDVYIVIDSEGKETLLPAIDGVIVEVDVEGKLLRVHPPEWE